jgi:hypothetical protein
MVLPCACTSPVHAGRVFAIRQYPFAIDRTTLASAVILRALIEPDGGSARW